MRLIDLHKQQLSSACHKHHVSRLYAFGSVLGDKFSSASDIDLLVDFEKIPVADYSDNYFQLKDELEKILSRPVDLIEMKTLKNPYFIESIEKTRELIYG